jgi:hypothetical protein
MSKKNMAFSPSENTIKTESQAKLPKEIGNHKLNLVTITTAVINGYIVRNPSDQLGEHRQISKKF